MDAELKAKWIEALRSGKYIQTEGILANGVGGFCCIGVLGEIQGCSIMERLPSDEDRQCVSLPDGLNAGLDFEQRSKLAAMNDGELDDNSPKTFLEIADYIEANL